MTGSSGRDGRIGGGVQRVGVNRERRGIGGGSQWLAARHNDGWISALTLFTCRACHPIARKIDLFPLASPAGAGDLTAACIKTVSTIAKARILRHPSVCRLRVPECPFFFSVLRGTRIYQLHYLDREF